MHWTLDMAQALPPRPGWRRTVVAGALHEEPDGKVAVRRLTAHPAAAPLPAPLRLCGLDDVADDAVVDALTDAFAESPERFGYPDRLWLGVLVHDLAGLRRDAPYVGHASVAAVDESGAVAGLVGLRCGRRAPVLGVAAVRRAWQRRGLGRCLLAQAVARVGGPPVYSTFLVANAASAAWHARVGFEEVESWGEALSRRRTLRAAWRQGLVATAERDAADAAERRLRERAARGADPLAWAVPHPCRP